MLYGFKNKLNRSLTIQVNVNPTPNDIFILPPYSLRTKELTDIEVNYIRSTYGNSIIIKQMNNTVE